MNEAINPENTVCTIAIPVYNRAQLVCAALDSALAQDAEGLEVLVIDNASTDGTWEALQAYKDPRLRLIRNESNLGLFGNLNRCLELARGEYVRILCSDDRLLPDCIARELDLLHQYPEVTLLSAAGRLVNAQGQQIGTLGDVMPPGVYSTTDAIVAGMWYLGYYEISPYNFPSGVMLRRDAARKSGGFDPAYRQLGDLDLWFKIARQGSVVIMAEPGCEILVHEEQMTHQLLAQGATTREWFLVLEKFATELKERNCCEKIKRQMTAGSLWFAFSFWRRGHKDAARQYGQVSRAQGISLPTLAIACVIHFALKILQRTRLLRLRPPRSLYKQQNAIICLQNTGRKLLPQ